MCSTQSSTENSLLIQRYTNHLEFERRYSPNTLAAVRRDLLLIDFPLEHANTAQLKTLLAKRHASGAAPKSLARLASSWRGFYAFLVQEGVLSTNPTDTLKTPKLQKSLPKAVGVDELAALLDGALPSEFKWAQAHTLIELLYATGLRISEALSLQCGQGAGEQGGVSYLHLAAREIRVQGKGNKTRVVPLIDTMMERFSEFLLQRNTHLQQFNGLQTTCLFLSRKGKPLSARQAQLDLAAYAQRKGLGQHLHPHMLRHSFGSHVLQGTQNLRAVQELLGHASIASTQIYTALDFSHLASVYDKAFPRAK